MDESEHSYQRYLFTVRFWRVEQSECHAEWRGQVQYAADGERRAFRSWPELVVFLTAKLEEIKDDDR